LKLKTAWVFNVFCSYENGNLENATKKAPQVMNIEHVKTLLV